jgi:hypothetical protein
MCDVILPAPRTRVKAYHSFPPSTSTVRNPV